MLYLIIADSDADQRRLAPLDAWVRKTYDTWTHPFPGVWFVKGPLAAEQVRHEIEPLIGPELPLIIVKAALEAMWQGIPADCAEWLADHFPGSLTERVTGKTEALP
jgi:hypothetical protein